MAEPDNIIRRMRFTYWIPKDTKTHSEYVIIIAFQRQKYFHGRATISRLHVHRLCLIAEDIRKLRTLLKSVRF